MIRDKIKTPKKQQSEDREGHGQQKIDKHFYTKQKYTENKSMSKTS